MDDVEHAALVKALEASRQEKDGAKRKELETAYRELLKRKTNEHPRRTKINEQRNVAAKEISRTRQRLRSANPQWVELSRLARELSRQANDAYNRLCKEDAQLTQSSQKEQQLRRQYSDELRALKENDRDLQKWITQLPQLTAQLDFSLAELRVNTPHYVRSWRASQAGPPRLLSNAGNNPALSANDPRIVKLNQEIANCQTKARELRPDSRSYVAKKSAELDQQVAKAKGNSAKPARRTSPNMEKQLNF